MGEKVNSISQQYFNNKDRKQLISHFLKLVEKENSKRIRLSKQEERRKKQADTKVKKEVEKKVEHIRTKKEKEKEITEKDGTQKQSKAAIYEGDNVRMINGRAVGTIEKFEKNKAIVNYGMFTTSVSPDELELVKRGPHGTSKNKQIVLFDGICNLCHGAIQFIIKRDPKNRFVFASLDSEIGQKLLMERGIDRNEVDSIVLIIPDDAYFIKSDAALEISKSLSGIYQLYVICHFYHKV